MAEKRKDSNDRLLFMGESQRKDGTYMYRYTDVFGKRHSVYAKTLKELRVKEKEVKKNLDDGVSVRDANITVAELLDIYLNSNLSWKRTTRNGYENCVNVIKQHKLSRMKIGQVRVSNIKAFYMDLYKKGKKKSTLNNYRTVLRCAFEIAFHDDWIRKNPAELKLDFISADHEPRNILPEHLEQSFLDYVMENRKLRRFHDIYILILDSGVRAGELLGLTLDDIDLKNRILHIDHQLCKDSRKEAEKKLFIESPKTFSGKRDIPMSDRMYDAIMRLIERRSKISNVEPIIDGYTGFLLLSHTRRGIITKESLEYNLKKAIKMYNECHEEKLPKMTPHCLRHTFCTRMVERGVDPHVLKYVMGHSDIRITYEIYTHYNEQKAIDKMRCKIV